MTHTSVVLYFLEMDLANVENNVAPFPNPTQLQDPSFLSGVFLMTALSTMGFEIFKTIGKLGKLCRISGIFINHLFD